MEPNTFTPSPARPGAVLADWEIKKLVDEKRLISDFVGQKVTHAIDGRRVFSYGLDRHGYDVVTTGEIWIAKSSTQVLDPKRADRNDFDIFNVAHGQGIEIPPRAFWLAVTPETFSLPPDIVGEVFTKSSSARSGYTTITTPLNADWTGQVTLEFASYLDRPLMFYPHEGVASIRFFHATAPATASSSRFDGQRGVTLPTL